MSIDMNHDNIKVGKFLVENEIISKEQLMDALDLQKDNPGQVLGEILVTQGILSKEELIMALEMYLMITDHESEHVDEWLDQDEIDMLMERIKDQSHGNNKM